MLWHAVRALLAIPVEAVFVVLALLVWAVRSANGLGPLLSHPGKLRTTAEFLPVFWPSLTAMIG